MKDHIKDTLEIVIPVFNEEEVLQFTISRVRKLKEESSNFLQVKYIFVDDGSSDKTSSILRDEVRNDDSMTVLMLSRNFGHEMALMAGLDFANADYVGMIDGDLQDPPELLIKMYLKAKEGYDVVYGRRESRFGETKFKKISAAIFYRLLNYLCDVDLPKDAGNFRVISRRVLLKLKLFREKYRYTRGLIPWIGFSSYSIKYNRQARVAGKTKYPLRAMIRYASNAIFSFSSKPLRIATRFGALIVLFGLIFGVYVIFLKLFTDIVVPGLAAILVTIIIFGGMQILVTGLVGEYIARVFEEVKKRPPYIVKEIIN